MKYMFEYCQEKTMRELKRDQRVFMAHDIVRDVQKIAKERGISEEAAYWLYSHGAMDGDRQVGSADE